MSDEALDMLFDESWREVGALLAATLEPEQPAPADTDSDE